MNIKTVLIITAASLACPNLRAEESEKVKLEEPKQPDLASELRGQPDGVLRVKANADGGFKSLVVKAAVEVEDVLGSQKGKQLARREAETKCKQYLVKWLEENCVFVETANKATTIITKGESSKDATGNTVKLRKQEGTETKVLTESSASLANATLRGLIVLHSEVTEGKEQEYVLIMGLSQDTIAQSKAVAGALSGRLSPNASGVKEGADDKVAPERKVNPAIKDF